MIIVGSQIIQQSVDSGRLILTSRMYQRQQTFFLNQTASGQLSQQTQDLDGGHSQDQQIESSNSSRSFDEQIFEFSDNLMDQRMLEGITSHEVKEQEVQLEFANSVNSVQADKETVQFLIETQKLVLSQTSPQDQLINSEKPQQRDWSETSLQQIWAVAINRSSKSIFIIKRMPMTSFKIFCFLRKVPISEVFLTVCLFLILVVMVVFFVINFFLGLPLTSQVNLLFWVMAIIALRSIGSDKVHQRSKDSPKALAMVQMIWRQLIQRGSISHQSVKSVLFDDGLIVPKNDSAKISAKFSQIKQLTVKVINSDSILLDFLCPDFNLKRMVYSISSENSTFTKEHVLCKMVNMLEEQVHGYLEGIKELIKREDSVLICQHFSTIVELISKQCCDLQRQWGHYHWLQTINILEKNLLTVNEMLSDQLSQIFLTEFINIDRINCQSLKNVQLATDIGSCYTLNKKVNAFFEFASTFKHLKVSLCDVLSHIYRCNVQNFDRSRNKQFDHSGNPGSKLDFTIGEVFGHQLKAERLESFEFKIFMKLLHLTVDQSLHHQNNSAQFLLENFITRHFNLKSKQNQQHENRKAKIQMEKSQISGNSHNIQGNPSCEIAVFEHKSNRNRESEEGRFLTSSADQIFYEQLTSSESVKSNNQLLGRLDSLLGRIFSRRAKINEPQISTRVKQKQSTLFSKDSERSSDATVQDDDKMNDFGARRPFSFNLQSQMNSIFSQLKRNSKDSQIKILTVEDDESAESVQRLQDLSLAKQQ